MTENELIVIIGMLCSSVKDKEAKIDCFDYYVNCAIKSEGRMLSKHEVIDKCLVYPDQFKEKK